MIKFLILLISVLLAVAFVTLLERNLLSYSQSRNGPNLVGTLGLLQPFADGINLIFNEEPLWSNNLNMLMAPPVFFFISLIFWGSLIWSNILISQSILYLLVLSSLGGILVFISGWNGGSAYSLIGGLRASAQMISYEVALSFFFLIFATSIGNLSLSTEFFINTNQILGGLLILFPLWILCILAETNRAPFDLSEGESELVSGFNTEFSALSFVFLFLGEYSIILGFSALSAFFFFQSWIPTIFFVGIILWIRSCFPRNRYDHLIYFIWIYLFPLILTFMVWWNIIISI